MFWRRKIYLSSILVDYLREDVINKNIPPQSQFRNFEMLALSHDKFCVLINKVQKHIEDFEVRFVFFLLIFFDDIKSALSLI